MIYKRILIRERWEIEISLHALFRAFQRGISWDTIEATVKGGRIERFGKNRMRFIREYKGGRIICVDERKGYNKIEIVTIERDFYEN